jgi:hypothetical protein
MSPRAYPADSQNYIGKPAALPGDSKSLTAPYFETLTYADMTLTYAEKIYKFLSAFVQRASAFKTGATSPTALSGSNLSSLRLCRRYLTSPSVATDARL